MPQLKVLNISSGDLVGSRFNGFDWHQKFADLGVDSKLLVSWNHHSKEEWVDLLSSELKGSIDRNIARLRYQTALKLGKENLEYYWSKNLLEHRFYREADVVHLQIIQDGTLDLKTIKQIMSEKPTVWTWHDPWPMTGHCVYPMECKRFSKGCGECPDLKRAFSIGKDHTRLNRTIKQEYFKDGYTLHIATKWFADYVQTQTGGIFPIPKILPFGIDLKRFSNTNTKSSLEIENSLKKITIGIRAVREPQKNFDLFKNALRNIPNPERYQIITLQEKGMLDGIDPRIQVTEIGWTNSEEVISKFFQDIDIFVMPSLFETFGFMALEAMASGVPVIGVAGTAVDEVCDLNTTGFSISGKSSFELQRILSAILEDSGSLSIKSDLGIVRAGKNFDLNDFCESMKNLYINAIRDFAIV